MESIDALRALAKQHSLYPPLLQIEEDLDAKEMEVCILPSVLEKGPMRIACVHT